MGMGMQEKGMGMGMGTGNLDLTFLSDTEHISSYDSRCFETSNLS